MKDMLEEQRQFPRVRLQAPVKYQIRGKQELNNAASNNISLGGVGFNNYSFIARGTLLMLQVEVLSRVLNSVARVCWVNSLPRSDRYQVGAEFMDMGELDKKYLRDYLDIKNT